MSDDLTFDLDLAIKNFDSQLKKANSQLESFHTSFRKQNTVSSRAFSSFVGNIGANVVASASKGMMSLTRSLGALGVQSIENASLLEDLTVKFEVLTGSASEASAIMKDLADFSASTPFQLEGIANAGSQLIAFGFESETVKDRLQKIGDVAAASGKPLTDLAFIYGQVGAAGKLTGERLNQLQEASVNVVPAIAKEMGILETEVRNMVSSGAVSFDIFEKAFNSLSDKGGVAFEGMIKKSKTYTGVISTLKDNFTLFSASIGKSLLPAVKDIAIEMTKFIQSVDKKAVQSFVIEGIYFMIDAMKKVVENINPIVGSFKFLFNFIKIGFQGLVSGFQLIEVTFAALLDNLVKDIREKLPDFLIPDSWLESLDRLSEATGKTTEKFAEDWNNTSEEITETWNALGNSFDNVVSDEKIDNIQARLDRFKEIVAKNNNEIQKENKKADKKSKKEDDNFTKQKDAYYSSLLSMDQDWITTRKQWEEVSNKDRVQNTKATLGTIASLTSQNNAQLFAIGKAASIAQATIDGFSAVQKALASAPPPFNFALATAVGLATAANIAKIGATQPPPKNAGNFTNGGIIGGNSFSGDNIVANVNSGEGIVSPRGAVNIVNDIAQGRGAGLGNNDLLDAVNALRQEIMNRPVVLIADDNEIARSASRGVQNGIIIGENR